MKKKVCCILLLFFTLFVYSEIDKEFSLNEIEFVPFDLISIHDKKTYLGYITLKSGNIYCGYGGGIQACLLKAYNYTENGIEIYIERTIFINPNDEEFKYRIWLFPVKYRLFLSYDEIDKALKMDKVSTIIVDTTQTYPTTCQAIVIDNLNIRDTPSLFGKKIGILQKASEVTLYEQSKNQEEIDGEKNFWYKVKVDEETYGWVYGAYVRIFFEDPSLGYSDKERILESLETL